MRFGVFTFAGVEMEDRGSGLPAPVDRRYDNKTVWDTTEQLIQLGVTADELDYESFWFTEHHFQYEGYEVTPNGIQLCTWLAAKTKQIKLGTMFNVVPQWHPLRLAEDFATLHNLSGGRGLLGVGRGTVPREVQSLSPFGVSIGSHDNPDQKDADTINREVFGESMEIIKKALDNETFSHDGTYFQLPPAGIPDRGGTVQELTLLPRPLYPYEIWQPVTSPPTLEVVPRWGHNAVFWLQNHRFITEFWERYGDLYAEAHGVELQPHENRMLVLSVRIADTREQALESSRPGHDEFWKFLGPYGWSRGYAGSDGKPVGPGLIPTLEESIDNKTWIVGTPEDVAEAIAFYRDTIGLDYITLFPQFAGDPYGLVEDQLHRFREEVVPLL
jgi:alkanesulfonate monooxygenase SsuD/methylene tetrahydromethanopterin reductase-like flavin-dependent oxidoreductase (luciferase family)